MNSTWDNINQKLKSNGGSISKELFIFLYENIKKEYKTLEFGSGFSTLLFDYFQTNHTSIEHSKRWQEKISLLITSPNTKLLFKPLINNWYDWAPTQDDIYDIILIDGPPGNTLNSPGRTGVLKVIQNIIKPTSIIILDDTHRTKEQDISLKICKMCDFIAKRSSGRNGKGRTFDILKKEVK